MTEQPDYAELARHLLTDHLGDIVALISAIRRSDIDGAVHILSTGDPAALVVPLAHLANMFAETAVGAEAWEEALTAWRPGQAIGQGLA